MNSQGAEMSDTITIRHTTEADREALRRLGDLDGGRAPAGPALAAYENGELVAAVGVEDGRTVADPFRYTAYLVRMLDLRIEQGASFRPSPPAPLGRARTPDGPRGLGRVRLSRAVTAPGPRPGRTRASSAPGRLPGAPRAARRSRAGDPCPARQHE